MKLKRLVLTTAFLAMSGVAALAAVFDTETKTVSGPANIISAYATWFSTWESVFNSVYGAGSFGTDWDFTQSSGSYTYTIGGMISQVAKTSSFFSDSTPTSVGFFVKANGTASYTSYIAPVPGPEAGAGVGALVLGGAALWMARRRKNAIAIA